MRKVEALAQEAKEDNPKTKINNENPYIALQQELSRNLGLKVKIQAGKVIIAFKNEEELNRLAQRLS